MDLPKLVRPLRGFPRLLRPLVGVFGPLLGLKRLSWPLIPVVGFAAVARRGWYGLPFAGGLLLALGATGLAPLRRVLESPLNVKLPLAGGKYKFLAAV
jgi:hypothetical protein